MQFNFLRPFIILSWGAIAAGCSSSGSSVGWPVVSSPFISTTTEAVVIKGSTQMKSASFNSLKTSLNSIVNCAAAADRAFVIDLDKAPVRATCYGPNLSYTNHPDGTPANGNLPSNDLGLWSSTNDGTEACTSAQITTLIESHNVYFNFAGLMGAALHCYVNTTESLPAEGATVTLSDPAAFGFTGASSSGTVSASSASVTGLSGGGYRYEITGTVTPTASTELSYKVIVQRKDGATETGTYSFDIEDTNSIEDTNCNDGNEPGNETITKTFAGKMTYSASGSTLNQEFKFAEFCNSVDPLDSNYDIPVATTGDTKWSSNFNYGLFSFDATTLVGTFATAWQAGSPDEASRVFNAALEADGTGTGYYGFGGAADSTTLPLGAIQGMVCNWAGPGGAIHAGPGNRLSTDYLKPYVQRQVLEKNVAGVWKSTADDIKYAPTKDCSATPGTLTYNGNDAATPADDEFSNDSSSVAATTLADTIDLLAFESFSFTLPTAPTF